jgi:putative peptidoglycan lipid II flippase
MSLNIIFSLIFTRIFLIVGWMPHGGLALANSLATALETVILLVLMKKRLNGLRGQVILDAIWKGLLASTVMAVSLYLWLSNSLSQPAWLVTIAGLIIGIGGYAIVLIVLRTSEIGIIWRVINNRFLHRTG